VRNYLLECIRQNPNDHGSKPVGRLPRLFICGCASYSKCKTLRTKSKRQPARLPHCFYRAGKKSVQQSSKVSSSTPLSRLVFDLTSTAGRKMNTYVKHGWPRRHGLMIIRTGVGTCIRSSWRKRKVCNLNKLQHLHDVHTHSYMKVFLQEHFFHSR